MADKPNKTQANPASVDDFLSSLPDDRREDSRRLADLMSRVSGEPACMWGASIVGFGVRHYRYDSGREGEICAVGFSPRKAALTLYGLAATVGDPLLQSLGKIKTGKGCVYVNRLSDIDQAVLERMVRRALEPQA
jgi:hypothetical protein